MKHLEMTSNDALQRLAKASRLDHLERSDRADIITKWLETHQVNGAWEIIQDLPINDFSRGKILASVEELVAERDAVSKLGLI